MICLLELNHLSVEWFGLRDCAAQACNFQHQSLSLLIASDCLPDFSATLERKALHAANH